METDRQPLEVVVDPLPQVEQDALADPAGEGEEAPFAEELGQTGDEEGDAQQAALATQLLVTRWALQRLGAGWTSAL